MNPLIDVCASFCCKVSRVQLISVLGELRGLGYVHLKDFDTAGDAEALLKRSDQSTIMINKLIAMAT